MRKTTDRAGSAFTEAVVIATRNRPDDLRRTLESIARQEKAEALLVLVIDGSDAEALDKNKTTATLSSLKVGHLRYPGRPAGTRQRNYGIDHLPAGVEIVHFIDDDVTVQSGYFRRLAETLRAHPEAGGVGGLVLEPEQGFAGNPHLWTKRLFMLDSRLPGRILLSGHTTPAMTNGSDLCYPVEWLSTCASTYRHTVFNRYRFDPRAEGRSPRLEDLDFSYRIGEKWSLLIKPGARLIHHCSSINRRDAERFAREAVVRRYWFIEKNIRHPLRKPAFWWSVLGQLLARLISRKPERNASLRGLMRGIRTVLRRDHPLLRNDADSA